MKTKTALHLCTGPMNLFCGDKIELVALIKKYFTVKNVLKSSGFTNVLTSKSTKQTQDEIFSIKFPRFNGSLPGS